MLLTLLYCLTMGWAPATGDVATYTLYLDGVAHQSGIDGTQASVCLSDPEPHTVTVRAFDAEGNGGPMSDGSDEIAMVIEPPLYQAPHDPAVAADLDQDGTVGYTDFGVFTTVFAKCNDGTKEVPCS